MIFNGFHGPDHGFGPQTTQIDRFGSSQGGSPRLSPPGCPRTGRSPPPGPPPPGKSGPPYLRGFWGGWRKTLYYLYVSGPESLIWPIWRKPPGGAGGPGVPNWRIIKYRYFGAIWEPPQRPQIANLELLGGPQLTERALAGPRPLKSIDLRGFGWF